jgi:hypothetical protein
MSTIQQYKKSPTRETMKSRQQPQQRQQQHQVKNQLKSPGNNGETIREKCQASWTKLASVGDTVCYNRLEKITHYISLQQPQETKLTSGDTVCYNRLEKITHYISLQQPQETKLTSDYCRELLQTCDSPPARDDTPNSLCWNQVYLQLTGILATSRCRRYMSSRWRSLRSWSILSYSCLRCSL